MLCLMHEYKRVDFCILSSANVTRDSMIASRIGINPDEIQQMIIHKIRRVVFRRRKLRRQRHKGAVIQDWANNAIHYLLSQR